MAFAGHVAGGHVADANDSEVADLAFPDEVGDLFVVPGIPVEEVHGDHLAGSFDLVNQFPFRLGVYRDGFFGDHVQAGGQGFAQLSRTGIGQSEQADGIEALVGEDLALISHDFGRGNGLAR